MKKLGRSALLLVVLAVLVSVLCMSVSAEQVPAEATEVQPGDIYSVQIANGGERAYFVIRPTESGLYRFQSQIVDQRYDTFGHLYDEQMTQIASDDDSGKNGQFKIEYELEAGKTYYLAARMWSTNTTGQFQLSVIKHESEDGWQYYLTGGNAIITACNNDSKELSVPATLGGCPVTGLLSLEPVNWSVEQITIPDSVTMLGEATFHYADRLKKVTLGSGISSIDSNTFYGCSNLEQVLIAADNPNYTTVGDVVYNKDVTKVVLVPNNKRDTIYIPDTVVDIEAVPEWSNFIPGDGLPQYVVRDEVVYTADGTTIVSCAAEKSGRFEIPQTVTQLSQYALSRTQLTQITIPETITQITYGAFFENEALEVIQIPKSVNAVGLDAFYGCSALEQIHIADIAAWCNAVVFDNPLAYGDLYLNGQLVKDLVIPSVVESIYYNTFANSGITSVTIPSSVKSIESCAFEYSDLEAVSFAEGLQYIGYRAFANTDIRSIQLPDSLQEMDECVFEDCYALREVEFGTGLNYIPNRTFAYSGIRQITIPENITMIGGGAFISSDLTKVKFEGEGVEVGGSAFRNCLLQDINLEGVSSFGYWAFSGNRNATIKIPETVTDISYRSFDENTNLLSVVIPTSVVSIDAFAFSEDHNLSHVLYTGNQEQWNAIEMNSPEINDAMLHLNATGDEITVNQTCSRIEHYCAICDQWTYIDLDYVLHDMKNGVCTLCGYTEAKNGWTQEDGQWYYYENGAKVCNDWRADGAGKCYLSADGTILKNGWAKEGEKWRYLNSSGYITLNNWAKDGYGWCFLDENGDMLYDAWRKDSKGWCYIGKSGYQVIDGWGKDSAGWCYLGKDGYMVYNTWKKDSKGWCYIGKSGYQVIDGWAKDSVGWCYLGKDGYMVYNTWKADSKGWCYINKSGYMVTNGWAKDSQGWYWMDASGYISKQASRVIGGKTYYFNTSTGLCTNP